MNRIKTASMWFFFMNAMISTTLIYALPALKPTGMKSLPLHTTNQSAQSSAVTTVPFMGKIVLPTSIQEEICVFHKGKTITLDMQRDENCATYLFSFLESKSTNVFYVLIASELSFSTEPNTNTLKYLQVLPGMNYRFYKLQGKRFYNNFRQLESYGWDIEEKDLPEHGIIPDETLIIMMDPDLLEDLESKRWDIETNTRVLPDFIVSSQYSPEQISKMLARSRFASLDLQSLHKNKSKAVKQRYRRAVAMLVH